MFARYIFETYLMESEPQTLYNARKEALKRLRSGVSQERIVNGVPVKVRRTYKSLLNNLSVTKNKNDIGTGTLLRKGSKTFHTVAL